VRYQQYKDAILFIILGFLILYITVSTMIMNIKIESSIENNKVHFEQVYSKLCTRIQDLEKQHKETVEQCEYEDKK
jgi:hypothetical protein